VTPGEQRAMLERTRDHLAGLLEGADEREAPALARELRMTIKDLADLAAPEKGSRLDDLAARREARLSGADGSVASD
jgi:hypothetical protein